MTASEPIVETCDLCIVGAGIAGLNALFVASQYLPRDARVVLVERKSRAGGMWNEVYDYVRLHQPYRMFTAGDIDWTLGRDPSYLATKPEVLGQFDHCLDVLRKRVDLVEYYGREVVETTEVATCGSYAARVVCKALDKAAGRIEIRAKRAIKAFGFRVPVNKRIEFSSRAVHSLSPDLDDLNGGAISDDQAPIYIIGGGKTGMDTAHNMIKRFPGREVHLLIGKGTIFSSRDKFFPPGLKRWYGGTTTLGGFLDYALRYDGTNEDEVFDYMKSSMALALDEHCDQFMFGILSQAEHALIANGSSSVLREYLEDIVDGEGGPEARLRSGRRLELPAGAWVINCSGYILREPIPYEPYLSEHGTTVSVQPTSAIHFLTTFGSYFLAHLFYLDLLDKLPLYELDFQDLIHKSKKSMALTSMTLTLYNMGLIVEVVPQKVMLQCGLDFDRWYPMYRRLLAVSKLRRDRLTKRAHFKATLDRIRERYDVRLGQLPHLKATV